jgi:hypothetical protein
MVSKDVPQVTIRQNASPNHPIMLKVLIVNQPGPFYVLEGLPFDLPHFPNHHE